MKKTIYTFLLSLSFIALFTTCKNPGIDYNTFSIKEENIQPGAHNVMVSGEYDFLGEVISMTLSIGLNEQLTDAESHSMNLEGKSFSVAVDSLNPRTSYYYCYVIEFGNNYKLLTDVGIFKTHSERPVVRTIEANVVDSTTISVKCIVDDSFGMAITERGICWNHTGNPQINDNHVTHQESGLGEYICEITGAELDVPYYIRAYAKNEIGLSYADEVLLIAIEKPIVETMPIDTTDFTQTSAYCWGRIINEGSSPVIERGICWGITPNPNVDGNYSYSNSNDTIFYVSLTNLSPNTTYYFCAYAINNVGIGYGEIVPFTTLASNMFRIEVICSPPEGGQAEVEGGEYYTEGEYCTVTATANDHYEFNNWTEDGQIVSNDANYSFPVECNRRLVANFSPKYYISATPNPINGGVIDGIGEYENNQPCTLTAIPSEGYYFKNWTVDDNLFSEDNPCTFNVESDLQLIANFTQVPEGGIDALFSVGSSSKVYFSLGNLQYQASTDTWQFAANQWEYLGNENTGISPNNSGWIDLFGWGTGNDPTCTGSSNDFYEWGDNAISNGGGIEVLWRTLSQQEWDYVINGRRASTINGVENARYVKATVNNIQGVILFPDDFENPSGINIQTNTINIATTHFNNNIYLASQWLIMEANGCVFLPVTGKRDGTTMQDMNKGYYWSKSGGAGRNAYGLRFDDSNLQTDIETALKIGEGVRLVHDYR